MPVEYKFEKNRCWPGEHYLTIEDTEFVLPGHPGQEGYQGVETLYRLSLGENYSEIIEELYDSPPKTHTGYVLDGIEQILEQDKLKEKHRKTLKETIDSFPFFRYEQENPNFGYQQDL